MSVLLGERWKALPSSERAVYVEAAKKIKALKQELENFKDSIVGMRVVKDAGYDPRGAFGGGQSPRAYASSAS